MTVRTRIAPSPTGEPHLGTAYIALFNLCFARSQGGRFILRIEDTDKQRSSKHFEDNILSALRWLGLDWDEGPGLGGEFGPYRQSERSGIYRQHVQKLLGSDCAFHCFCTSERLTALRERQRSENLPQGYDGACAGLSASEIAHKLASGQPHVVRMHLPREGSCKFKDGLRSAIEIEWQQVDMQILLKSDGMPTYHLANVVDDHLMGITHVIRGEEWINSTPKHLQLYEHFGWQPPAFYHLPLLRNPDQSKLSKRKNPTSINYYRDSGMLPEALLNYLALMGWSMPDKQELFSLAELLEAFDIKRVSLGGSIFDQDKLNWLSGQWMRQLSDEDLLARFAGWLPSQKNRYHLVTLLKDRIERFDQVIAKSAYLLGDIDAPKPEAFAAVQVDAEMAKKILQLTIWRLNELQNWQRNDIQAALSALAGHIGLKIKGFLPPLFLAIAGNRVSLPLFDSIMLLGKDVSLVRLSNALSSLGGCSKKELKVLEKEWHLLNAIQALSQEIQPLGERLQMLNSIHSEPNIQLLQEIIDAINAKLQATLALISTVNSLQKTTRLSQWWLAQTLWLLEKLWSPEKWALVDEQETIGPKVSVDQALSVSWQQLKQKRQQLLQGWRQLLALQPQTPSTVTSPE